MSTSSLHQQLSQKVQGLFSPYQNQRDQQILAKFDRTLFRDDFAQLKDYLREIEQTLAQLAKLSDNTQPQTDFYSQKLLAQCHALIDALQRQDTDFTLQTTSSQNSQKRRASERQQMQNALYQLPPRERLAKYYEFLLQLNEIIENNQLAFYQARSDQEKQYWSKKTQITQQRRDRCQEAIDLLEEYLSTTTEE
ncbi:primosomal replication protein N'' [[Pasteurella] mairii]|uniref:Primosomal replication protein N n=1 Tax=[Pasteurella] mairii TaxID=757 RepID=A0A379B2Q3_9PAST|nr:primosomal replication protein N'' [[Pasteurella] mairii]